MSSQIHNCGTGPGSVGSRAVMGGPREFMGRKRKLFLGTKRKRFISAIFKYLTLVLFVSSIFSGERDEFSEDGSD